MRLFYQYSHIRNVPCFPPEPATFTTLDHHFLQRMRFILLFILISGSLLPAQSPLYIPRNIQKSYTKGTRSMDGKPGANYWQNQASYNMEVSINPKKRLLKGTSTVVYTNNSPDSLKSIRIKLAHDLYKKGGQRQSDVTAQDIDDGVDIQSVTLNGQPVGEKEQRRGNTFLDLLIRSKPLAPRSSVTLTFAWQYVLPSDEAAARECVCDPSTFFVAYWYPQVAVYDDLHGWADMPYTGMQEFYNDFNDYDVTVTMPGGYQVWATGEWQNPASILQKNYLDRYQQALQSDEVVHIFTEAELKSGGVFQKGKTHTFRYVAKDVPDFVFAASDHYHWDALSVVVDDKTRRRTFVGAAYKQGSKDYYKVARIAADGIRLMSTWLPGYPFPYPCMTVFDGNDGMEYPMMCNDASVDESFSVPLTVHEVSHTYFPFMMGTNEQEYAWMDEGWASFFDYHLTDSLSQGKGFARGYGNVSGNDFDIPLMVRTSNMRGQSYGIAAYQRPQAAYLVLYDMLGHDKFRQCMQVYMDQWKGKHPMPLDFFNTWNDASGTDLNWFWKSWFYDYGFPDLAVAGVEPGPATGTDMIIVKRVGKLPVPVFATITYSDGEKEKMHRPADVWKNESVNTIQLPGKKGKSVKMVELGHKSVADADKGNNKWER